MLFNRCEAVLLGSLIAQAQPWRAADRSIDWPAQVQGAVAVGERETNAGRIAR